MATYDYRCRECEALIERTSRADTIKCQVEGCKGWARRLWGSVNFNKVPGGGRDGK